MSGWFGDRYEIEHVVDVLRDLGQALRVANLPQKQRASLQAEGLPHLRELLERELAPWLKATPRRSPNTFEEPAYKALALLWAVRDAGELEEPQLEQLERHLVDAHLARLDADAVTIALRRLKGTAMSLRKRKARTAHRDEQILADARRLRQSGYAEREIPGILARKHGLSPKQIRNILKKGK
jgi:hypothetical protein